MDDGLNREPCKDRIPFRKQQRVPQPANASVAVSKRMDQLKFIMEYAALDEHGQFTFLCPFEEIVHQLRYIIRKSSEMQDSSFAVHDTHGTAPEHTAFLHKSAHHNAVRRKQSIFGIGIQTVHVLIKLKGILYHGNIFRGEQ